MNSPRDVNRSIDQAVTEFYLVDSSFDPLKGIR